MKFGMAVVTLIIAAFTGGQPCLAGDASRDMIGVVQSQNIPDIVATLKAEQFVTDLAVIKAAVVTGNPEIYHKVTEKYIGDTAGDTCLLINSLLEASVRNKGKKTRGIYDQVINNKSLIIDDLLHRAKKNPVCTTVEVLTDDMIDNFGYFQLYRKIFDSNLQIGCMGNEHFTCGKDPDNVYGSKGERVIATAFVSAVARIGTSSWKEGYIYSSQEYENETLEFLKYLSGHKDFKKINQSMTHKIGGIFTSSLDKNSCENEERCQKSIPEVYRLVSKAGFTFPPERFSQLKEIEKKYKQKSDNGQNLEMAWKANFVGSFLSAVTSQQPSSERTLAGKKLEGILAEACRGLNSDNRADAKAKLMFLLGKGGDPSIECWGSGPNTVTWNILKEGDLELAKTLVGKQRDKMALQTAGNDIERFGFVEFAMDNGKEDTAVFLLDSGFKLLADPDFTLASAVKRKFSILSKALIAKGASPEKALLQLLGDESSAEIVIAAGGERKQALQSYYREERKKAAERQAALIAAAAKAFEERQKALAKKKAEEQERYARLANQPKRLGEKVCMSGKLLGLFKVTVSGYVDGFSGGSSIHIRIADTEHQSVRYNNQDLWQGVMIWDDHRMWINCSTM